MRLLFLFILFLAVFWFFRILLQSSPEEPKVAARKPEDMAKCDYCGVYQPVSECAIDKEKYYCCKHCQHKSWIS